jgi:hypothetical protein
MTECHHFHHPVFPSSSASANISEHLTFGIFKNAGLETGAEAVVGDPVVAPLRVRLDPLGFTGFRF